jgi:hypothetical protein
MLAVLATAALSACGSGEEAGTATPPVTEQGTVLTISVVADEGAAPNVMELTCDPAGGDHPNAEAACTKLAAADGQAAFKPTPEDQACSMIFGGPQTATIAGTYQGADVNATFSRENGCEINRWDALGTEVFDVPLQ